MISQRSYARHLFVFTLSFAAGCDRSHLANLDLPGEGKPDAGTTAHDGGPAIDEGGPVEDAGATVEDAGVTVEDAGVTVEDAGATVEDAGMTVPDAGAGVPDAGSSTFDAGSVSGCGALQQCQWSSMYFSGAHGWMSEPTPAACMTYCNSFPDTVCCTWEDTGIGSYPYACRAFFDPACATPSATIGWQDPGCGSSGDFTMFWGSICTQQ